MARELRRFSARPPQDTAAFAEWPVHKKQTVRLSPEGG
jgi:hypothetical protein